MTHVLSVDGGARGNPGPAAAAFVLRSADGSVLASGSRFLGTTTNNVAEYRALLMGLEEALDRGVGSLDVRSDSELVVKQLAGEYRVKNEGLAPLHSRARDLLAMFDEVRVEHVPRAENADPDALANAAMDARSDVLGEEALHVLSGRAASGMPGGVGPEAVEEAVPPVVTSGGTYGLTVSTHFDAAHALRGYQGECRELHGHTWDVEATVEGERLDDVGIVYDFKTLKSDLAEVLEPFDHAYLNEVTPFDSINATAENLARIVFESLQTRVGPGVRVTEVAVWESPVARITYRGP